MTFRERYNRQISLYFLVGLFLHIPILAYLAYQNEKGTISAIVMSLALYAGPLALYLFGVRTALLPAVLAFTTIGYSGLMIHFGNGMIEMHFHIFISLAIFIAFGLRLPILVGAATTAIHHIALFFILPTSLFNYQASFAIVLLHALFVVLETGPCLFIAARFQKLIDLQDSTISEIEMISQKLTSTVESMASSGEDLAQTSAGAASALQETAASLEQLNSTVQLSANNATHAATLSQQSKLSAENGDKEVKDLIASMNKISSSSKKIEEIIHVIDDIAFQTNLLALNAAVEAARAGEQGRGFAVVADAVRSLAQKSAASATDINRLIKENVVTIEQGSQAADRSGEVLQAIVVSVHKVSDLINEIATASQEQSSGISQISRSVTLLDSSAQKNAQSSMVVSNSAHEIQDYSKRMESLVTEFNKELGLKVS